MALAKRSLVFLATLAALTGSAASGMDAARSEVREPTAMKVSLRVDNNLAGIVRALDSDGMLVPVRADVTFLQDGDVVTDVLSDEQGAFQVRGIAPGEYSVIAESGGLVGAYLISIEPYSSQTTPARPASFTEEARWSQEVLAPETLNRETAELETGVADPSLEPTPDTLELQVGTAEDFVFADECGCGEEGCETCYEECYEECYTESFGGGACCGGGGGFGGAWGLVGLAGLAGLSGLIDCEKASPHSWH